MRNITIISVSFIALCFTIIVSCNKNEAKESDFFYLTNDFNENLGGNSGFKFETLEIIHYINFDDERPDFIVRPFYYTSYEAYPPYFISSKINVSFAYLGDFDDFESALQYYNSFEFDETKNYGFSNFTSPPAQSNQIWLVKLDAGKHGLLLVVTANYYMKRDNTPFVGVLFKAKNV